MCRWVRWWWERKCPTLKKRSLHLKITHQRKVCMYRHKMEQVKISMFTWCRRCWNQDPSFNWTYRRHWNKQIGSQTTLWPSRYRTETQKNHWEDSHLWHLSIREQNLSITLEILDLNWHSVKERSLLSSWRALNEISWSRAGWKLNYWKKKAKSWINL